MTISIAASIADQLVGQLQAALVVARTNGSAAVTVPDGHFRTIASLLNAEPELAAIPLDLRHAELRGSADEVKTALELTCTRCDLVLCDAEHGDPLSSLAAVAAEHERTCAEDHILAIDQLATKIREVDGNHTLGAGRLAELLVNAGWRKS